MLTVFSKLRSFLLGQEVIEAERRRAVRIPCRVPARIEGAATPVNVVNLSVLGLRLESAERLRKNTVIVMEGVGYPGHPITARVVWCTGRGGQWVSGLMFIGSNEEKSLSWVRTALDKLGAAQGRVKERRAHVRVPTEVVAYLANRSGDRLCEGHMRNLGLGGALFLSEVEIAPNTPVMLQCDPIGRMPKIEEEAQVRSCRKDVRTQKHLIGLQFSATGSDQVRKALKIIQR